MQPEPRRKNRGYLGADSSALSPQDRQDRRELRYQLDLNSFNFRIWVITASGFLTDSYNLFATNVILASIQFVYFPDGRDKGLIINLCTLLGSVIGQLLFGFLADYYGRTRLYGIELVLVIVSTIGVATSSFGHGDLDFFGLFTWWRFVMGIGIGAEYPLSACITSEWSSTQSRATMLSAVFLMQPVGQALAQLVGLVVLLGQSSNHDINGKRCGLDAKWNNECQTRIDGVWRIVIGIGALPALLAIIFRFFLYDCGLYTLEVKNKPGAAFRDTQRIYGEPPSQWPGAYPPNGLPMNGIAQQGPPPMAGAHRRATLGQIEQPMPVQFSLEDLRNFFIRDGNWFYLLGTSMTWFFLDVSFYGFSLDNRKTLSDLWATAEEADLNPSLPCWNSSFSGDGGRSLVPDWKRNGGFPVWQTNLMSPCKSIDEVLIEQATQYLVTVSIPSIAGSACFIFFANRFHRRRWLTASFFTLAVLFLITGGVYYAVSHTPAAPANVVMVALCHFAFNFGANTLTFIIPAEIFPTTYRCTCHGIAAAAGKLGSIVAVGVVYIINHNYKSKTRQGLIFLLFAPFMVLGALYSWAYLPEVQRVVGGRRLEPMTLEDLGEGRAKAQQEGQVITVRDKIDDVRRRRRNRRSPGSVSQ
ncbi:hypothetical protein GGTG_01318 [Gaeumannomyces tritici R3-111a-1]|uniref:Major facilitator superfamily (MFS) profile domain-containing protein n=1 Tax=Gaeumannomyces tritici (strain R3-111a-1) TaxID=644352 RepID=J3NJ84_GAET3|nr:hypothetical protein GGTG_01318 [Gaeumannomyces tritici R3-111a-1]EJT81335.1 hypothetical protein GGTG_01318 [Gaeumannomyces tritici R3-111a-1]